MIMQELRQFLFPCAPVQDQFTVSVLEGLLFFKLSLSISRFHLDLRIEKDLFYVCLSMNSYALSHNNKHRH